MPDSDLSGAADAAERLCSFIATTPIDPVGRVTASIGVAELTVDESPEGLCGSADAAMYRAKEDGRNRVRVSRASRAR